MDNHSFHQSSLSSPYHAWHGTTVLCVRHKGELAIACDGQVTLGQTVLKGNANKIRRLQNDNILAGFAGSTADALTLLERLTAKIEQYPKSLMRACVELGKEWRTDRMLSRMEAMLTVADKEQTFLLSGNGDVLEPELPIIGIGSGGSFAQSAAIALARHSDMNAEDIITQSMTIAADLCIYTNHQFIVEKL